MILLTKLIIPLFIWLATFYFYRSGMRLIGCEPADKPCKAYSMIWGHRLGFMALLFCIAAQELASPTGRYFDMKVPESYYIASKSMVYICFAFAFISQGLITDIGKRIAEDRTVDIEAGLIRLERKFINAFGSASLIVACTILIGVMYANPH